MYLACGSIVFISSVWLLIGNAINYRLLAKEKNLEQAKKKMNKTECKESEPLNKSEHHDDNVQNMRPRSSLSERETNI